jgi:hypothetical protein
MHLRLILAPAVAGLLGLLLCLQAWPVLAQAQAQAQAQEPARGLARQAVARPAASAEQRVALVIGNNAYKDAPLTNPVNDARAMADALRTAGFTVKLHTDINHRDFLVALREFGDALRRGGVGVFYFAGHGMQIKGRNYLIPAGATIEREDEVAYAAIDAQAVLDKMEAAGNATNLVILDACRNNPFARSFRSASLGLAQMEAPVGTLVAFATAPGSVASDGQGQNGLYTQHLLQALRKPGMKVEDVFKQTRAAVRRDSQGKQIPWESTSLEGDFYFSAPPAPVSAERAVEEAFWASVKDGRDAGELRAFLKRYPQSAMAAQARDRLAALEPLPRPAATPTPAMPPVPVASRAPAPATANKAAARSNAQGYTVGDKWNYQVVDRFKGEVVRNYTLQVSRMEADGGWATSGGTQFDAVGRLRRFKAGNGDQREFSPHAPRWWPGMKVGDVQRHEYEYRSLHPDTGASWTNRVQAEGRVLRREKVRVPAGEFDALLIEFKGRQEAVGRPGAGSYTVHIWYVPEIHTQVAIEETSHWDGKIDSNVRDELTSLRLVNHPDLP